MKKFYFKYDWFKKLNDNLNNTSLPGELNINNEITVYAYSEEEEKEICKTYRVVWVYWKDNVLGKLHTKVKLVRIL